VPIALGGICESQVPKVIEEGVGPQSPVLKLRKRPRPKCQAAKIHLLQPINNPDGSVAVQQAQDMVIPLGAVEALDELQCHGVPITELQHEVRVVLFGPGQAVGARAVVEASQEHGDVIGSRHQTAFPEGPRVYFIEDAFAEWLKGKLRPQGSLEWRQIEAPTASNGHRPRPIVDAFTVPVLNIAQVPKLAVALRAMGCLRQAPRSGLAKQRSSSPRAIGEPIPGLPALPARPP
jgi:hypothetical protein